MAQRPASRLLRSWPQRSRTLAPGRRARAALGIAASAMLLAAVLPASVAAHDRDESAYLQHNLVSDVPGRAAATDASLVNAWGLSFGPATPLWVSDNGTDVTTLYTGSIAPGQAFTKVPLTVSIPGGAPTGQIFNPTTDFVVTDGTNSAPARFIFASEAGMITGWNPAVPPPAPSTTAQPAASIPGAVFKGLAIATSAGGNFLYAADFHHGRIAVFNGKFDEQHWPGAFRDRKIPRGYAPFNVQNLGGMLYVTYAKQDAAAEDDVAGQGHGFVDVFDMWGHLQKRLIRHGQLNSPWGLAMAPAGWGEFSGDLLVGNFGNGRINAYDPRSGEFEGTLRGPNGRPLVIDGLWGLLFGNGVAASTDALIFSAGPDDESHGLLGTITLAANHDD